MPQSDKFQPCAKCGTATEHWLNPNVPVCFTCFDALFGRMKVLMEDEKTIRESLSKLESLAQTIQTEKSKARRCLVEIMDAFDQLEDRMYRMTPEDVRKEVQP